ncbi:hypothetical protein EWM64_g105 [Hericium alpestre]|uniref:Uncharacterized protein n=1 Tax=Hericium alpestre TaxID=135208 RepID=A0A4Z0AA11_9AGAM|nr:hypothetical protein EWM64_g105 [Hericium alpestre]
MSTTAFFKSLRLSQAEYDRHAASQSSDTQDMMTCDENSPKLKIIAESEEVKEVLREASNAGEDWILVPYDPEDMVESVMHRIANIIRIPEKHLRLAGNEEILPSWEDVSELDFFTQTQTQPIEAILLPTSDVDGYVAARRKVGRWRRFPFEPPAASELPANPHARAQALFPVLDTTDSAHWADYIIHRQAAESRLNEAFERLEYYDENAPYWSMIRDSTLGALYGEDDLTEEECHKIADSVANTSLDAKDDGCEIRDANVITRIHSLVAPKSVDMHLTFHHRTRMYSVEYGYSLGFRINKEPVPPLTSFPNSNRKLNRMHSGQGWTTFGWFYLDDRRAEHSACPVSARHLKQVHDALFGPAKKGKLGERMSLRGTAKLMLASLGIAFDVAVDEEDKDENGDGHTSSMEACLELAAEKPGISAAHLRKICGIPPLKGDDTADLSKEQVTAPMDPSEDEYGSDDDGYGRGRRDEECIFI